METPSAGIDNQDSPYYAFPAIYPPSIIKNEDPFPCRFNDFSFFSDLPWPRKYPSDLVPKSNMDVESLTYELGRLKISNTPRKSKNVLTIWGLPIPSKTLRRTHKLRRLDRPICTTFDLPVESTAFAINPRTSENDLNNGATDINTYAPIPDQNVRKLTRIPGKRDRRVERRKVTGPYLRHSKSKIETPNHILTERTNTTPTPKNLIDQSFDLIFSCSNDCLPSSKYLSRSSDSSSDIRSSPRFASSPPDGLNNRSVNVHSSIGLEAGKSVLDSSDSAYVLPSYNLVIDSSSGLFDDQFTPEMPVIPRFPEHLAFLPNLFSLSCDLPPPVLSF